MGNSLFRQETELKNDHFKAYPEVIGIKKGNAVAASIAAKVQPRSCVF